MTPPLDSSQTKEIRAGVVTGVEAIPFRIPLKKVSKWGAHGVRDAQEHVLVRIATKGGVVGLAEAPARPTIYGETQRSIVHIIRDTLAPMLIGKNVFDREGYQAALVAIPWNPTAKGALDIAMHEAAARICGLPLASYLGGAVRPVETAYMLGLGSGGTKAIVDEALTIRERTGICAFKVKAGADPTLDIENVRALRKQLGDSGFIFIDANQQYSPDVAVRTILQMREHGLAMAEEPIPVTLGTYRRKVADSIGVPILADDSVFTLTDVRRELQDGSIGVVGIKTARTGMYDSERIMHLAEAYGLPCWVSSQGASAVGTLASAHFAAAFKNVPYPCDLASPMKQEDDLLSGPLEFRDGKLHLTDAAGIGVDIDEPKLKKYRLDW